MNDYNILRKNRFEARNFAQLFSQYENIRYCGHSSFSNNVDFYLGTNNKNEYRSSIKNLITCKSLWACPWCSYNIASVRSAQLSQIFSNWSKLGYHTTFATFTVSHNNQTKLDELWSNLLKSWKMFQQGKGYYILKKDFDLVGSIRATEATHGKNGFHLHLHVVFFHTKKINQKKLTDKLFKRWQTVTLINNLETSPKGFKIVRTFSDSGLSTYLNKNSYKLSQEITKGQFKYGNKSRTPFTILKDLKDKNQFFCDCVDFSTGEFIKKTICDFCIWQQWEKASRGKRQLGYSGKKSLFEMLSVLELNTDLVEDNLIIFNNEYIMSVSNPMFQKMKNKNLIIPFLDKLQENIADAKIYLVENNILFYTIKKKEQKNEEQKPL
jgi:hypothetical protein